MRARGHGEEAVHTSLCAEAKCGQATTRRKRKAAVIMAPEQTSLWPREHKTGDARREPYSTLSGPGHIYPLRSPADGKQALGRDAHSVVRVEPVRRRGTPALYPPNHPLGLDASAMVIYRRRVRQKQLTTKVIPKKA